MSNTGYKGFDKNLKCRDMQYEVGKEFETDEKKLQVCSNGLHYCEHPLDVFCYYPPADSRYAEVENRGKAAKGNDGDSKVASSKLFIKAEISLIKMIQFGVSFILSKVDFKNAPATNTGDQSAATNTGTRSAATNTGTRSAATNTGYQSAATNTGYQSAATNTGTRSAATNTGDQSAATNTGTRSAATNTGYQSAATNTGYQSAATNTGTRSAATNTGYQSAATNTGYQSAATNTGDQSAATNTGTRSAATVEGKESVAINTGREGKARGKKGCWIVLSEWKYKNFEWTRISVKSFEVDGKKVKEDTFYTLKSGKLKVVKD